MAEVIVAEMVSEEPEEKPVVVETTPKYTQQETEDYIKGLRSENAKLRKESDSKLEKEKEAKKLALEEQGKYKELYETTLKEAEAEKGKRINTDKRNALRLALRDAKAIHPELLETLFRNDEGWTFDLDGSGKIENVDSVISPIKEKYADSFGETTLTGIDAPEKHQKSVEGGLFSQAQMEKMTDKQLADNYEKVEKSVNALSNN